eukprot:3006428-Rhodomonas_salina.2
MGNSLAAMLKGKEEERAAGQHKAFKVAAHTNLLQSLLQICCEACNLLQTGLQQICCEAGRVLLVAHRATHTNLLQSWPCASRFLVARCSLRRLRRALLLLQQNITSPPIT